MPIENVIQEYNQLTHVSTITETPFIASVVVVVLLTLVIGVTNRKMLLFASIGSIMGLFICYFMLNSMNGMDVEKNTLAWKKDVMKPYLNSLEEQRVAIDSYRIISPDETVRRYQGITKRANYLGTQKREDLEKVKLNFVTEGHVLNEWIMTLIVKKEKIKTPYLTYKKIEKTVSNKYPSNNYYDAVLHVPESESITKALSDKEGEGSY